MKTGKSIALLLICTCLALGFILLRGHTLQAQPPAADSALNSTTAPSAAVTQPASPQQVYVNAQKQLLITQDLTVHYTYTRSRTVGGAFYSEVRTGQATYLNRNTDSPEVLIQEDVSYGDYRNHYTESYLDGCAYLQTQGVSFLCDIGAAAYLQQQLPISLIQSDLYETMEFAADTLTYHFRDASRLESWADPDGQAQLIHANGTVVLNADHQISQLSYHAEYTLQDIPYTLEVTLQLCPAADLTDAHPDYPQDCAVISNPQIPRYLLQTVGDVYAALSLNAEYTDTLDFELLHLNRTETGSFCTTGSADTFQATLSNYICRSNDGGSRYYDSYDNTFLDGQYSVSYNGGDPVVYPSVTAENVRESCEDAILSSLLLLKFIANAQIADSGDSLYITFEGNDAYIENISGNIYSILDLTYPLELTADSYSTEAAGGYLVISKATGHATAMGLHLSRTHTFDGVSYSFRFQRDQTLMLSEAQAAQPGADDAQPQG